MGRGKRVRKCESAKANALRFDRVIALFYCWTFARIWACPSSLRYGLRPPKPWRRRVRLPAVLRDVPSPHRPKCAGSGLSTSILHAASRSEQFHIFLAMSFAGHVFDMIARMKANQRRKRDPFDRDISVYGRKVRPDLLQKASAEELQNVRQRILAQRSRDLQVSLFAFLVSLAVVMLLIWWIFF